MGLRYLVGGHGHLRYQYRKLRGDGGRLEVPRRRWVKKVNGALKGLRLSRSRKLSLKVFSVVDLSSRISKICADIFQQVKKMDDLNPHIIFSTQWGLPVLSHASGRCKRSVTSLHSN